MQFSKENYQNNRLAHSLSGKSWIHHCNKHVNFRVVCFKRSWKLHLFCLSAKLMHSGNIFIDWLLPSANEGLGIVMFLDLCALCLQGWWLPSRYHRSHDQGDLHLGPLHPRGLCIQGVGQTSPPQHTWDTTGYGQQAGGTHPTGMLSC